MDLSIVRWDRGQPSYDGEQSLTTYWDLKAILHIFCSNYYLCLSEDSK